MDYYKQGDPANADKIKAAFEKLGIDVLDFGFADASMSGHYTDKIKE